MPGCGSIQQFEADVNTAEGGNGVMVGVKFDYDGPVLPGNRETNPCLFDHWSFACRPFTLNKRHAFAPEDIAFLLHLSTCRERQGIWRVSHDCGLA